MKKILMTFVAAMLVFGTTGCGGCTEKRTLKDFLKDKINEKCNDYVSYATRQGEDVGLCDEKFVKHSVSSQSLFQCTTYNYRYNEYEFNNDSIINNIFSNGLYYTTSSSENNNYSVDMILNGNSCESYDYYKNDIVKMINELQKFYNSKVTSNDIRKNKIDVDFYLTPTTNFKNDNYYKVALVSDKGTTMNTDKVEISKYYLSLSINADDDENTIIQKFDNERKRLSDYSCK